MSLGQIVVADAAFSAGAQGLELFSPALGSGVVGWPDVAASLARIAFKLHLKAVNRSQEALDLMVTRARELVPEDTGLLLSGITGERDDDMMEFRASAVHADRNGGEDYARFVELGTRAGERRRTAPITAQEGFYGADEAFVVSASRGTRVTRNRRSHRTHPGTDPQPFFFPAANEALVWRDRAAQEIIPEIASEEGY